VIIRLSKQQQSDLLEWSAKTNWAHFSEDCIPPGYDLVISVSHVAEGWAEAKCGSQILDLGEVDVTFE